MIFISVHSYMSLLINTDDSWFDPWIVNCYSWIGSLLVPPFPALVIKHEKQVDVHGANYSKHLKKQGFPWIYSSQKTALVPN